MRLIGSTASPFVAKVRMAALVCDLELDFEVIDVNAQPDALLSLNPLGKIPVLVTETGTPVFDSTVICELLDRITGNALLPQTLEGFAQTRTFEAAASGVMDALILCLYEERYRPEEKRHSGWVGRQMAKADRGLDWLDRHLDELGAQPTLAHCALAALLGWMELRFAGKAEREHPRLAEWRDRFFDGHPRLKDVKPHL
ncbi:glutathione S-transferase [Fulvimarina endophytica]|uniref:Glutathione S-transferase n=1 Tax=Fulvimarina endophytica TaxID=2293836 RepID=A0A371WZJ2_9HYPH|nr:glutathione S-transferase N-terminal domain-containing protein [Fulvimarina endophytica]RFC62410.1 glutathione S-transferase [Fulvimarina endophytica]